MEHVEEAGVHSGDSACVVPPPTLSEEAHKSILRATEDLAEALEVRGLINIQFAVKGDDAFVLEANPRASRTVPFISKASGIPLAKVAARVMLGATLADLRADGVLRAPTSEPFVAVKEAVMPWDRFPEQDSVLGPEMRATGEVMGVGADAGVAYAKALLGGRSPASIGWDRPHHVERPGQADGPGSGAGVHHARVPGGRNAGTARYLTHHAVPAELVNKVGEGPRDTVGRIEAGEVDLVINTPVREAGPQRRSGHPPCRPEPEGPLGHHHPRRPRRGPQPPCRERCDHRTEEFAGVVGR